MHIRDILKKQKPSFSFEFFPPKTEKSAQTLYNTIKELTSLNPSFVSVTYGAGGSTRELTRDLVKELHKNTDLTVIPHLTCVGSDKKEIHNIVSGYREIGIENILALRGDTPKGMTEFPRIDNGFFYAEELVAFLRREFPEIGIGVAGFPEGHPETPNSLLHLEHLKQKIDAGADYICTQLFFDNHMFYDYLSRCKLEGINVPILAGVMPVQSLNGIKRMAELAACTRFPAALLKAVRRAENEEKVSDIGVHWASQQVMDLLANEIDGIHFYTLNHSKAAIQIYQNLGISTVEALAY